MLIHDTKHVIVLWSRTLSGLHLFQSCLIDQPRISPKDSAGGVPKLPFHLEPYMTPPPHICFAPVMVEPCKDLKVCHLFIYLFRACVPTVSVARAAATLSQLCFVQLICSD